MNTEPDGELRFTKSFIQQEPIPEDAIDRAVELLRSGQLHRYSTAEGDAGEVALLEHEFAEYVGARYCLGLSSCGAAIFVALKCAGVQPGDPVLANAFTLAPVPGAIEHAGGRPVLVEITKDYLIDLEDLETKAIESGARFLLLSHMRGHIADMDRITDICGRHGLLLIEDCAHTAGCRWGDRSSGTFGEIGCFSTQTYKHINSGEGGLLVTDDDIVVAQAILYSGSYMLYDRHISRPEVDGFLRFREHIPNYSLRMSNLSAALIRPQLRQLDRQCVRWNERYDLLSSLLTSIEHVYVPRRDPREHYVGSSLQFSVEDAPLEAVERFVATCLERGIKIKWFGRLEPDGFTSTWKHWRYLADRTDLPRTEAVLQRLCDIRIPLTFTVDDCRTIAAVIGQVSQDCFS